MSKNTKKHPYNECVVSVQLDMQARNVLEEMKNASGLSMSELLKRIIWKATSMYSMQLIEQKKRATMNVLNSHMVSIEEIIQCEQE